MLTDNFMMRRNLGLHGEVKFAELLEKKGFAPFFPYRDTGVDIAAIKINHGHKSLSTYQVKSRNKSKRYGTYWFQLRKKDIRNNQAQYWVFAIFTENNRFVFLRIPFKILSKWVRQSQGSRSRNILSPDANSWWLKVDQKGQDFLTVPKKGSIKLNRFIFR